MSNTKKTFRYWTHQRQRLGKLGTQLAQVLRDVVGVYSSHPSAPLSLYARVQSFTEQAFYNLDEEPFAYRVPAMRQSVHMLPKETAHLVMAAVLPSPPDHTGRGSTPKEAKSQMSKLMSVGPKK